MISNIISLNELNKNNDLFSSVKSKLDLFILDSVNELVEDGEMCLELCEMDNDYHMTTYWISGTYDEAFNFLTSIKDKKELNLMLYQIKKDYPGDIEKLKEKTKHKNYNKNGLALEMLASILLKEYQKCSTWYTVYGCEEEDMADFDRYNIVNALGNQVEFPVMQIEDVIGAMFEENVDYGVRHTVQSSDLYDVFAYYADNLKLNSKQQSLEKEYVFTPDTFEYEGIVYRCKKYLQLQKDKNAKGINLLSYAEMQMNGYSNIKIIREKYLYEFNDLKFNLFNKNNFLINKLNEKEINIRFVIDGIENKEKIQKEIYNKNFSMPIGIQGLQDFVIYLAEDIKVTLAGKEKIRNKDIPAIKGLYPRKELATHGLQFIKNLAPKNRKLPRTTNITSKLAELQSLYIMKKSLRLGKNLSVSCSFGMDSVLVLYLLRKIKKDAYDIIFNNSRVEYGETIAFKEKLIKEWNLTNVIETLPVKTYWELQKNSGWNFQDKGDRNINKTTGKKVSASEQCCYYIKHLPMMNLTAEKGYDTNMAGVRADESRARLNAGKRDGVFYFTNSWNLFRINPILFWTNEMTKSYVNENNVPYSEIYDKKLLDEDGNVIYEPRTGCWCCLLNAKRNYLKWLKKFKPEQYNFLMKTKGLAKDLYAIGMNLKLKEKNNQISIFDLDNTLDNDSFTLNEDEITDDDLDYFVNLIEKRPCIFLK